MRSLWFTVLVVLLAAPALASIDESRQACVDAAAAYEDADFDRAAQLYQEARDLGLDTAVVHYNLGNARFKQGQLGEAIASYLRGTRIDPRDPAIRTNLERARAQIKDVDLSGHNLPPVLRPFQWGYARFSANEWLVLALVLLALLAALRITAQWRAVPAERLRVVSGVLLAASTLAFVVGGIRYRQDFVVDRAVVVAEEVEVRSGPGMGYNLAFRVHEGLPVRVAENRGDWLRINLGGELVGWVPAASLEAI